MLDIAEYSMHLGNALHHLAVDNTALCSCRSDVLDSAIAMYLLLGSAVYIHPDGALPMHSAPVFIGHVTMRKSRTLNPKWRVPGVVCISVDHQSPLLNFTFRQPTESKAVPVAVCTDPTMSQLTMTSCSGTTCTVDLIDHEDHQQPPQPTWTPAVSPLPLPPALADSATSSITVTSIATSIVTSIVTSTSAAAAPASSPASTSAPAPSIRFDDCAFKSLKPALSRALCVEESSTVDGLASFTPRINLFVMLQDLLNKRTEFVPLYVAFRRLRDVIRQLLSEVVRSRIPWLTPSTPLGSEPLVISQALNRSITRLIASPLELLVPRKMNDEAIWNPGSRMRPAYVQAPIKCYLADLELEELQRDTLYHGIPRVPHIKLHASGASPWFCNRCASIAKTTTPDGTLAIALDSLLSMFESQAGLRWYRKKTEDLSAVELEMRDHSSNCPPDRPSATSLVVFGKHPLSASFLKHTFLHVPFGLPDEDTIYRPCCPFGCYLVKNWTVGNPQGSGKDEVLEERIDVMIMHASVKPNDVTYMCRMVRDRLCGPLYVLLRSTAMRTMQTDRQARRLVDGGWALYSYLRWCCHAMQELFAAPILLLRPTLVNLDTPLIVIADHTSAVTASDRIVLAEARDRCMVCFDTICVCDIAQAALGSGGAGEGEGGSGSGSEGVCGLVPMEDETCFMIVPHTPRPSAAGLSQEFSIRRVIEQSLKPKCPCCRATYVLEEGCTHIHCPECGNHHCFTCGRQYPKGQSPGTGREMTAAVQKLWSRSSTPVELVNIMDAFAMPGPHERAIHALYFVERIRPGTVSNLITDCCSDVPISEEQFADPSSRFGMSELRYLQPGRHELLHHLTSKGLRHNARFTHGISGSHYRYGCCPIYIEDFVDVRYEEEDHSDTDEEEDEDRADRCDHHKSKHGIFDTRLGLEMVLCLSSHEETSDAAPTAPTDPTDPTAPTAPTDPTAPADTAPVPDSAASDAVPPAASLCRMHFEVLGKMAMHESGEGADDESVDAPSGKATTRLGAGLLLRFVNFLYRWLRRNRAAAERLGMSQYDLLFMDLLAGGRKWAADNGVTSVERLVHFPLTVDSFMAFLHIKYGGIMLCDRILYTLAQVNDASMSCFQHSSAQLDEWRAYVCPDDSDADGYWKPMMDEQVCRAYVDSLKFDKAPGMINLFKLANVE